MSLNGRLGILVWLAGAFLGLGCSQNNDPTRTPTALETPATDNPAPATLPPTDTPSSPPFSLLIPAYFGAESFDASFATIFQNMDPRVSVNLIINPASGPGDSVDVRYTRDSILPLAHQNGCKLLGYVYCSTSVNQRWVLRPENEIIDDIDRWIELYHDPEHPLSGFFFDLMPSDARQAAAFARITNHARDSLESALIVANPGTTFDLEYHQQQAADAYLCAETFRFSPATPPRVPTWVSTVETAPQFAAMAKDVDAADWKWMFEGDALADFAMVYVTDLPASGEYQQLASFYSELVEAVALANGKRHSASAR